MAAFSAPPIGCLLMAAGNASRFGENKLTARFDGQSLFSRALEAIPAERVCPRHGRFAVSLASGRGFASGLRCHSERPARGRHQPHHPPRHTGDGGLRRYLIHGRRPAAAAGRNGTTHCGRMAGNTRTALPPQHTTESAATRACFRRGFSRSCVHWRQTAAAHPSFGGTKMRCCSSRQENTNCSTATQSRRWKF